jgi:hypothetical protein
LRGSGLCLLIGAGNMPVTLCWGCCNLGLTTSAVAASMSSVAEGVGGEERLRRILFGLAIMVMVTVGSPLSAMAQATPDTPANSTADNPVLDMIQSTLDAYANPPYPYCGHYYCDWYPSCKWEYWGWDPDTGWVLLTTDGDC